MIPVCRPDKYNTHIRICSAFIGIIFQEFSMLAADEHSRWKPENQAFFLFFFYIMKYSYGYPTV